MNVLITGGSSGVGQACVRRLRLAYTVHAPSRSQLDLSDFSSIEKFDLSNFDIIINCAGSNVGAYLGWKNNSWQNQADQVAVNFTGCLLLAKQYVKQRSSGQFIFVTSYNIEDPIALNIFYTASKAALRFSMQALRKDEPNFLFSEICPGKIKTNMLKQNYQGSKTESEIEEIYKQSPSLSPDEVAMAIEAIINNRLNQVTMVPHAQ